eukprot:4203040-Amphidinium_carterae.1
MRLEWHRIPTIDLELEALKQRRRMSRVHRLNPRRKRRHLHQEESYVHHMPAQRDVPKESCALSSRKVDIPGCITNA